MSEAAPTIIKEPFMTQPKLSNFDAVMIAEGAQEADEATILSAWQQLHDTGLAYELQGWFGRTAAALIEQGYVTP